MIFLEIPPFKQLAEMIVQALGAKLVKSPEEVARKKAFALYNTLDCLSKETDVFIGSMERLLAAVHDGHFMITKELGKMETILISYRVLFSDLTESLGGLNPQLNIHRPTVVKYVLDYRSYRGVIVDRMWKLVEDGQEKAISEGDIAQSLEEAKRNRDRLKKAIDSYRKFLVAEFPFKQSFDSGWLGSDK